MGLDFDPLELRPGSPILARWAQWVSKMILVTVRFHAPLRATRGGGGRWLDVRLEEDDAAVVPSVVLIKTSSTITARSSTTPGSGSAVLVTGTTSTLSTGATITLRNWAGTSIATAKYGTAVLIGGVYWVVSIEC
jgi:hypothetical protein